MKGKSLRTGGKHVCCRLAGMLVGIGLDAVQEINRIVEPTFVPLMEPFLRGLINLRGQLVTVIDLNTVVSGHEGKVTGKARTVVVEVGDEILGLVVDEVGDVVDVAPEAIEALPSHLPAEQRRWFQGMVQLPGELLLLLDVSAIERLAALVNQVGTRG